MFTKPRVKKSALPSHIKMRNNKSETQEVIFDNSARHEYLTGFHRRKLQRIKNAQEAAANRARLEKLEIRNKIRSERRRDMESHIHHANKILKESNATCAKDGLESENIGEFNDWKRLPENPNLNMVGHEEDFIDEDRYTSVTVESVSVSRDGLSTTDLATTDLANENYHTETAIHKNTEDVGMKEKENITNSKAKKNPNRYKLKLNREHTSRKQKSRNCLKRDVMFRKKVV